MGICNFFCIISSAPTYILSLNQFEEPNKLYPDEKNVTKAFRNVLKFYLSGKIGPISNTTGAEKYFNLANTTFGKDYFRDNTHCHRL